MTAQAEQLPFDPPHKPIVAQSDERYCRQCNSPKENCKCEEVDECPQCGSVYICSCVIKKKRVQKKTETINTPYTKRRRTANKIADNLKIALWFIDKVGDVALARRVFEAAAHSLEELSKEVK